MSELDDGVVEFDCVDCGIHVFQVCRISPQPARCATCTFLFDIPDETEREKVRAHLARSGASNG